MAFPLDPGVTKRPELMSFEEFNLRADREGFIGLKVLPPIDVPKSSGTVGKIPAEELLKEQNIDRAPGAEYPERITRFDTYTYQTTDRGLAQGVDDNNRQNWADYLDADRNAVEMIVDGILRAQEKRIADLFVTGTFNNAAATAVWSNASSATPVKDVDTNMKTLADRVGILPNTLILPWKAVRSAWLSDEVKNRLGLSPGSQFDMKMSSAMMENLLAQVFGIERVLIAKPYRNTANEGQAASFGSIWTATQAVLLVCARTNNPEEPCVGRSFHWPQDGSSIAGTVEQWRDEAKRRDMFRVRHQFGEKIIDANYGQIITDVM